MKSKWKYIIVAVISVAVVAGAFAIYSYDSNSYVAKMAGERITVSEYKFFLGLVKYQLEANENLKDEEARKAFWSGKIDGEDAVEYAKNEALEQAKEYKIELLKAKQNNIKLTGKDNQDIKEYIDKLMEYQGEDQFKEDILKEFGTTYEDYKTIQSKLWLTEKFKQAEKRSMKDSVNVSEEYVKDFYQKNRDSVDEVTVTHILFSTVDEKGNPLPEGAQAKAKKNAQEMLKRVNEGEDIKELAKQYSEDPGVEQNGGEYSFKQDGQIVPEFKNWAFEAQIGDTGIVKTDYGYHVMKLQNRTNYKQVKDAAKNKAKESVLEEKYQQKLDEWKKDPKYNIEKNDKVFESIQIK